MDSDNLFPSANSKPDVTLSLKASSSHNPDSVKPEERGVRLIQLLLSCAKHASSGNLHHADAYLRQISELSSVSGDSMQRLSAWFAYGLAVRLLKRWPGLYKALGISKLHIPQKLHVTQPIFTPHFPYLGFAYSIISRTLVRGLWMEPAVHIVGLGSGDPRFWSQLIRCFAQATDRPPHLKVTCVCHKEHVLEALGHDLVKEAKALELPFQFNPVIAHLRDMKMEMLTTTSHETVAIVSVLSLHALLAEDDRVDAHFGSKKSSAAGVTESKRMMEFLATVRSVSPKLFFLVEQEANHNTNRLVDRLIEGLHYYSAVFDSIDTSYKALPSCDHPERRALEEILGREIENIVSCEGQEREERHEKYATWMVRFGRVGFKPVRLWLNLEHSDGQDMFETPVRGYKAVTERACTMISWHDRPIYAVSAWTC